MDRKSPIKLHYLNFAVTFGLIVLTVYILFVGKFLILPLVVAIVFWYIIAALTALYGKIHWDTHYIPHTIAFIAALISAALILYVFFLLLAHSIVDIINQAPLYQKKLQEILHFINNLFGSKLDVNTFLSSINISTLFSRLASILSVVASNFVLILIYLLFLLLEYRTFDTKIKAICKTTEQQKKIEEIINKISGDINNYFKIVVSLNFMAGLFSYFTLLGFGIDYAEFWGVLIFLLHFIPYIGPIAAVVFVLLAVSIQITTLPLFLTLAAILILIQFLVGSVIEPKWMGTRLNLSPVVILVSLTFWGAIWGIPGMFLSVPLMVILNIIFAKFPATRAIAVMLSEEGKVDSTK